MLKNKTILIADAGSTKTDWAIIENNEILYTQTSGINPFFTDKKTITVDIEGNSILSEKSKQADRLYFYGSGCSNSKKKEEIYSYLNKIFRKAEIKIHSDILGASRALFQIEKGIVCILGTGSNCCLYNGIEITRRSPSLGYIAGDEGSGSYMGKELIRSYFYGKLNPETEEKLKKNFQMERAEVLHQLYKGQAPNQYLSGFSEFIYQNKENPDIKKIIEISLEAFFENHLLRITSESNHKIRYTGSIAWHFQEELKDMSDKYKLSFHGVTKTPIKGLVQFHQKDL